MTNSPPENSINYDKGSPCYPSSFESEWFTIANANTQNAYSGELEPGVNPIGNLFSKDDGCSTLLLGVRYSTDVDTVSGSPVVRLFGRTTKDNGITYGPWMALPNRDQSTSPLTLTANATNDIKDGNWRYGSIDPDGYWFDTLGCNRFMLMVTTPASIVDSEAAAVDAEIIGKWL